MDGLYRLESPLRRPATCTFGGLSVEARGPTSPHADFWRLRCTLPTDAWAACSEALLGDTVRPPAPDGVFVDRAAGCRRPEPSEQADA